MKNPAQIFLTSVGLLLLTSACVTQDQGSTSAQQQQEQQAMAEQEAMAAEEAFAAQAAAAAGAAQAASAVSSAQPANAQNPNLSRDAKTQVVTDKGANLQWEDNTQESPQTTWDQANEHCNNLKFADHSDWRLATTAELVALAKATKVEFSADPILKNISFFDAEFWSSTTVPGNGAEVVNFRSSSYGEVASAMQYLEKTVRCARKL